MLSKKLWHLQSVFVLWPCYIGLTENSCLNDVCIKGGQNGERVESDFHPLLAGHVICHVFSPCSHFGIDRNFVSCKTCDSSNKEIIIRYLTTQIFIHCYRMNGIRGPSRSNCYVIHSVSYGHETMNCYNRTGDLTVVQFCDISSLCYISF